MLSFARKRWPEIVIALVAVFASGVGYSMSTNRHLGYAPCLAKVMSALRVDPAEARWMKISSEPVEPQPKDCAIADDVARDANRVIGDLLISDATLFDRLQRLLIDAGMECQSDQYSIICDCKSQGPFAIANPCEDCNTLVDLPLPFKRALFVAVNKRTALRNGKTVQLGRYIVEVSYATALIETERPPPLTREPSTIASQGSYEVIDQAYEW